DMEADLGIDSIKRVEILGALRERHPDMGEPDAETLAELRTLRQVLSLAGGVAAPATGTAIAAPAPTVAPAPTPAPVAEVAAPAVPEAALEAAKGALLEIVAEKTGYPSDVLDLDMDMEADLGIDSIKRVEILGALRERHPDMGEPDAETLAELRTLRQVLSLAGGAVPATSAESVQPVPVQPVPVPRADIPPAVEHQPVVDGVGRAEVRLTELPAASLLRDGFREGARILIAGDDRNLAVALAERLRADGLVPVLFAATAPGIESRVPAGADEASLAKAIADGGPWNGLVYLHPAAAGSSLPRETEAPMMTRLKQALAFAKYLKQPLAEAGRQGRTAFVAVTRIDGALGYEAPKIEEIAAAGLSGLVKTFAVEAEGVFSRYVDLEPALAADTAAELLWAEMRDADGTLVEVGCKGDRRVTLALSQTLAPPAVREPEAEGDELFIVTGGARGVTSLCVREMARRAPRRFLLLGRSPVADADPAWAAGAEGDAALKAAAAGHLKATRGKALPRDIAAAARDVVAAREIRILLADLKAGGSEAVYVAADIADPAALATLAMRPEITRAKRLSLIHGAGALADALIERKSLNDLDRVYSPKIFGLAYLMKALPEHKLGRLWLFSSVAGLFGNVGQVDYAMANETLNRVAALWMRRGGKDARSINWGAWDAGMVTPEIRAIFAERGVTLIPPQVGAAFFADELKRPAPSSGVLMIGGLEPLSRRVALLGALESAGSLSIIADWSSVLASQAVADHKIGGRPVLPAAFALATAMATVERLLPGWRAIACRSFRVLSGVVVDETLSPRFVLTVRHAGRIGDTDVLVDIGVEDKQGRPRFRIEGLQLSSAAATAARPHSAKGSDPNLDAGGFYRDGTLFHGMALRLLKAYASNADQGHTTFLAEEPDQPVIASGALFSAAMGDVLLQAALAATRLRSQMPSLPMRLDNLSFDGPPAPGSRYRVEAEIVTEGATETVWRVTAVADGGLRLTQVDAAVIRSSALAERFALSAE
ncbi:MAG TPA: KR domain-containing protein, partial [Arenibaculum sp.]|nr:KR domain-containing protein [Arenibaculum sp.]